MRTRKAHTDICSTGRCSTSGINVSLVGAKVTTLSSGDVSTSTVAWLAPSPIGFTTWPRSLFAISTASMRAGSGRSMLACAGEFPALISTATVGSMIADLPSLLDLELVDRGLNQAAPVNAPVASRFHSGHLWRRVTEQRR